MIRGSSNGRIAGLESTGRALPLSSSGGIISRVLARTAVESSLSRWRVSLLVGVCSMAGAFAAGGSIGVAGVAGLASFLLCAGCSAVNQWQERRTDILMERTSGRPLPTGRMTGREALLRGAVWSLAGGLLYCFTPGAGWALFISVLAVPALYNGIYTPLKRHSPMAVLAGGVPGALPPLVGWLAGGGAVDHPVLLGVCGALYLWQVPHFWLLSDRYRDEYRRAGLAVARDSFSPPVYRGILTIWTVSFYFAAAAASFAAALPGLSLGAVLCALIAAAAVLSGGRAVSFLAVHGSLLAGILTVIGLSV